MTACLAVTVAPRLVVTCTRRGDNRRMAVAPDYLNPGLTDGLRRVRMPVVDATDAALRGYGFLVDDRDACQVAIQRWPAQGWRTVDEDSGDEGGSAKSTDSDRRRRASIDWSNPEETSKIMGMLQNKLYPEDEMVG